MKGLFVTSFFCVLLQLATNQEITNHPNWNLLNNQQCGNSNSERIIGGRDASLGAYPWIARLGYKSFEVPSPQRRIVFRCGGSLLNPLYVVTAAHCVINQPYFFQAVVVRLGENNAMTDPDCQNGYCAPPVQDIGIQSIAVHPKYNRAPFLNDIALVRLKSPAQFNDFVLPICLMRGESYTRRSFIGEYAQAAGWGFVDIWRKMNKPILQTITEQIIDLSYCQRTYVPESNIGPWQLCVGGTGVEDTCNGDSGGPLMVVDGFNGAPRYFLIGIVSYGPKQCATQRRPSVFTRVDYYFDWILNTIQP